MTLKIFSIKVKLIVKVALDVGVPVVGMGCALSSSDDEDEESLAKRTQKIDKELKKERKEKRKEMKVLLLGTGESGKSTIVKQMKIIHDEGYSIEERLKYLPIIYKNIIDNMKVLVQAMNQLGIEFADTNNKVVAKDYLELEHSLEEGELPPQLIDMIELLWKDEGLQRCYERSNEYQLGDSAFYFLDNIERISTEGYVPIDQDMLRARVRTTTIIEFVFHFKNAVFVMVDVGGQRSERRKWISCFEGVQAILFVSSAAEYDQRLVEDESKNRMIESLELFEAICNSPFFVKTAIILFLNKKDLFDEKLAKSPLEKYFPDYKGQNNYIDASTYIKNQFLSRNHRTNNDQETHKELLKIYAHFTIATDTSNINKVFDSVSDSIIQVNILNSGL